jgi:MFS family permease
MVSQAQAVAATTRLGTSGWVLAALLGGQAMATMDSSIVNVAIPSIQAELPATGAQVQLVSAGYVITFAACMVTAARLGDRFGHGRLFTWGLAGFTLASLGCGLAPSAVALILARSLQGAAGALMVPQVLTLIQLRFQGAARARAIGIYSMVLALAVAAGQILGGVIVTADLFGLGWRPALLVNLPVGLALLVLAHRMLPRDVATAAAGFDLIGVAVMTASMVAIVAPLVFGRAQGWPVWLLVLLAAGVGGLVTFGWYERSLIRRGAQPLLDLRSMRPPGARAGLLACCLVMGAYTAFIFTLTMHLQRGLDFTPLQAGLTFVPFAVGFGTVSLAWTRLPKPAEWLLPVAGPLAFAGGVTALFVSSASGWSVPVATALLLVAGAGHAASFSPLFARLGSLVGARFASALSALGNTGTLLVGAVSIAGLGSVYLAVAEHAPQHSRLGLGRVVVAIDAMLLLTAICALWTVTRRQPRRAGSNIDAG